MTRDMDEADLREAIRAAKQLQHEVQQAVAGFPPEGRELKDKVLAAAERTVVNLELALEALLKGGSPVH